MKRMDLFAGQGARRRHSKDHATTSNAAMRKKPSFHIWLFLTHDTGLGTSIAMIVWTRRHQRLLRTDLVRHEAGEPRHGQSRWNHAVDQQQELLVVVDARVVARPLFRP